MARRGYSSSSRKVTDLKPPRPGPAPGAKGERLAHVD